MIYYIEIAAKYCSLEVCVNGLKMYSLNAEKTGSLQAPINSVLIGENNRVSVAVRPATVDLDMLEKIQVEGIIKKYAENSFVTPESGELVSQFSLQQRIEELQSGPFPTNISELIPFQIFSYFDSLDNPSFKSRLLDADPIDNKEALLDWAIKFRDLLKEKNTARLFELYKPKLDDYDIAYPMAKEPDNFVWFSNFMNEKIYPQTPFVDFDRDDIRLFSWCNNRIWEIQHKNGMPLWYTLGKEGRQRKIGVFVGMVDKEIKIVR